MARLLIVAATAFALAGFYGAGRGQTAPAPVPAAAATAGKPSLLPPGPGHDTMVKVCSSCHAPEIAAQQRLSPAGWHEMVETMVGRGAQGSDADFEQITAYLAKNFPDKPAAN